MSGKKVLAILLIVVVLLAIDWLLGVTTAARVVPYWVFFLANIPFGAVYIWFEAQWTGSNYVIAGQIVDEIWSFVVFLAVILAQASLYFAILNSWKNRRNQRQSA